VLRCERIYRCGQIAGMSGAFRSQRNCPVRTVGCRTPLASLGHRAHQLPPSTLPTCSSRSLQQHSASRPPRFARWKPSRSPAGQLSSASLVSWAIRFTPTYASSIQTGPLSAAVAENATEEKSTVERKNALSTPASVRLFLGSASCLRAVPSLSNFDR